VHTHQPRRGLPLRALFVLPILCLTACGYSPTSGVRIPTVEGALSSARVTNWADLSDVDNCCSAGNSVWVIHGLFFKDLIRIDPDDPSIHPVRTVVTKLGRLEGTRDTLRISGEGPSGEGTYLFDPASLQQLGFEPRRDIAIVVPDRDCGLRPTPDHFIVRRPNLPDVEVRLPAEIMQERPETACAAKDSVWLMTRARKQLLRVSIPDARELCRVNLETYFPSGYSPTLIPADDGTLWLTDSVLRPTKPSLIEPPPTSFSRFVNIDASGHVLSKFDLDESVWHPTKIGSTIWAFSWHPSESRIQSIVRIDLTRGIIDARIYQRIEEVGINNHIAGLFEHAGEPWMWTAHSIRRIQPMP
jgi:hypothetical protein